MVQPNPTPGGHLPTEIGIRNRTQPGKKRIEHGYKAQEKKEWAMTRREPREHRLALHSEALPFPSPTRANGQAKKTISHVYSCCILELSQDHNIFRKSIMKSAKLLRLIAALAVFVATHYVYRVQYRPYTRIYNTGLESLQLANSLALHGTFSDPFQPLITGPSAHVAPGYPALVAVIIHYFGNEGMGNYVLGRVTIFVVSLQLSLLPFLARHLGLRFETGLLGAASWLVATISLQRWEADYVGLLAVVLGFPMYTAFHRALTKRELACTGALWGLLLLLNPSPIFVLVGWLVALRLFAKRSSSQLAIPAIVTMLLVLPWIIRNYLVFHELVFLRDNLGLELAVSNNPCAQYSFPLNFFSSDCFSINHPDKSIGEAEKVLALGEVKYNHERMKDARQWIAKYPGRFAELSEQRFVAFWFPSRADEDFDAGPIPRRAARMISVLTALSVVGLVLLWLQNRASFVILVIWLLFYPPVYYVVQFDERYRHPILWVSLLLGCYPLVKVFFFVFGKWARSSVHHESQPVVAGE